MKKTKKLKRDEQIGYAPTRIVVRFKEGFTIPKGVEAAIFFEKNKLGPFDKLAKKFKISKISPVFTFLEPKKMAALVKKAMKLDPTYQPPNFDAFYYLDVDQDVDYQALVKYLLRWDSVQEAYIDQDAPDPVVDPSDDPRSVNQGYLDPAPDGIDAEYAWGFTGGDGEGQRFIDLEQGWTLDHEDLIDQGATLLHGTIRDSSRGHGTSVLGQVCAVDNAIGCVGITPNIDSVDVVSFHNSSRVNAILAAILNLNFGDTLLLEAQVWLNGSSLLGPIEAYDAEFEAIRLATALGIIVIEAGGNGTNNGTAPALNMDTYTTLSGLAILNRDSANPEFRDSGAIIVTAATSTSPHTRLNYGPFGRRVDCYAWAQNINTLSSDSSGNTDNYRTNFGGTSGASPIITGAALAVQGRAESQLGFRFSPAQMRAILSNPANGTPPAATESTLIGVMPDLRTIFNNVFNVAPDVYIRDNVGDVGEPHLGSIASSPDIIVRPTAVANPQAAFGQGSGTENSNGLSQSVEFGQDNFIYLRLLNQGGSNASDVEVTVYWSPASTLVTPDLWNLIGTVTVPNVPVGEILTVSNALVWPSAQIPAPGHYCYVAIINHPSDPAPTLAEFNNWDNFTRFIRDNNNVTWKNFNVVNNELDIIDVSIPRGFFELPFIMPGAPDIARPMGLEFTSKLPKGSKVLLEIPLNFFEYLANRYQIKPLKYNKKNRTCLIGLNPQGKTVFERLPLPAKSRFQMRSLVHIPKKYRKFSYDFHVRQMWEKQEVGRVTWRMEKVKNNAKKTKKK